MPRLGSAPVMASESALLIGASANLADRCAPYAAAIDGIGFFGQMYRSVGEGLALPAQALLYVSQGRTPLSNNHPFFVALKAMLPYHARFLGHIVAHDATAAGQVRNKPPQT